MTVIKTITMAINNNNNDNIVIIIIISVLFQSNINV